MDDDNRASGEQAIARLVAIGRDWAEADRLTREQLDALLDEVQLPARLYSAATDALADAGLRVVDTPSAAEDDDDPGPALDGFGAFMSRAAHEVLTFEEEQELGRRIDAGRLAARLLANRRDLDLSVQRDLERAIADGHDAEDDLARHNIRLVVSIAAPLRGQCGPGIEMEDLVQEGWLGLVHAIGKWEYQRGLKFSTYATWWIRQSMDRALANKARIIRLPVHFRDELRKVVKAERVLKAQGEEGSAREIAEMTELSIARVNDVLQWRRDASSLDRPIGDGGLSLGDFVASDDSEVEIEVEQTVLSEMVHEALAGLTDRERQVIDLRFGLTDGRRRTLDEIGRDFGVTRERIRQIEGKALVKLRHPVVAGVFAGMIGEG